MFDITLRCFSRARWLAVATNRNIIDADGNPNPGFSIDEIGNIVLTPAVIDPQTLAVITPAVMDTWYWINLRIYGAQETGDVDTVYPGEESDTSGFKFTKSKLVKWVRDQSTPVNLTYAGKTIRTYQFGAAANRIQLIDPRDYATVRVREWLGGQSY